MDPDRLLERRRAGRHRDRQAGLLIAFAVLSATVLAGRRAWHIATSGPPPVAGALAPTFSVEDLEGHTFDLEQYRGRVVLLDFWATWCPPCVATLPGLNALHQRLSDRGFGVVGVNQEPGNEARVRAFVSGRSIRFPVVVDPGYVSTKYGVFTLPTSVLVDQKGVIRAVFRGAMSERRLERAIEPLLEEANAGPS